MKIKQVQEILYFIEPSKFNVVLYGKGDSHFDYHFLSYPQGKSYQTSITSNYKYYSKNKPKDLVLYARIYKLHDLRDVIKCGNYTAGKVIINSNKSNDYYTEIAHYAIKHQFPLMFDYDNRVNNTKQLELILNAIPPSEYIEERGICKGTRPIIITAIDDKYVYYRENFNELDNPIILSKIDFLKLITHEEKQNRTERKIPV
jgi:hypothetical protein